MNYKKQIKKLLALVVFFIACLFIMGYLFDTKCQKAVGFFDEMCHNSSDIQVFTQLIVLFSLVAFIFLIPLYFLKEAIYLSWRKFAVWYLPIVAILILLAGSSGGNGFNPGYGMDSESLTFFFSGLFTIISLILIAYKSIKLRGK